MYLSFQLVDSLTDLLTDWLTVCVCVFDSHDYVAAGGQRSQLVIRHLPTNWWACLCAVFGSSLMAGHLTRFGQTTVGGSINNSLEISKHLNDTRILICNNDETIKVHALPSLSRVACLKLPTSVNSSKMERWMTFLFSFHSFIHSSRLLIHSFTCSFYLSVCVLAAVSPDGRKMIAVGDTNQVFVHDISTAAGYKLTSTLTSKPKGMTRSSIWLLIWMASYTRRCLFLLLECFIGQVCRVMSRWLGVCMGYSKQS